MPLTRTGLAPIDPDSANPLEGFVTYEKNISTQSQSPCEKTRLSFTDGDAQWTSRARPAPRQGPLAAHRFRRMTHLPPGMPSGRFRFHPLAPLRCRREFDVVYSRGRKQVCSLFVFHAVQRDDAAPPRLGLTISKRCGNACIRNRIRRRVREVFRLDAIRIAPGWDFVITARSASAEALFGALRDQLRRALSRLGALRPDA